MSKITSTKNDKKTKEQYLRENCEICNNRFECSLVNDYDSGNKNALNNCNCFDDVYAR